MTLFRQLGVQPPSQRVIFPTLHAGSLEGGRMSAVKCRQSASSFSGCHPACHTLMVESYGMKKTLHIDESLLREARSASGARSDTDTVRLGLEALVRQAAYDRLRALRGKEPKSTDVPRRREAGATKKHSAA